MIHVYVYVHFTARAQKLLKQTKAAAPSHLDPQAKQSVSYLVSTGMTQHDMWDWTARLNVGLIVCPVSYSLMSGSGYHAVLNYFHITRTIARLNIGLIIRCCFWFIDVRFRIPCSSELFSYYKNNSSLEHWFSGSFRQSLNRTGTGTRENGTYTLALYQSISQSHISSVWLDHNYHLSFGI